MILITGMPFFYFYPLKMNFDKRFEPKMLIIMKNSQLNIKKKCFISSLWKVFLDFFSINITRHYGNLDIKCFFVNLVFLKVDLAVSTFLQN